MRSGGSTVHVSTISQIGTTWTKASGGNADPDYGVYGEIWGGQIGASASTSLTINFSSSSDYVVELFEFSGLGVVDKTATNNPWAGCIVTLEAPTGPPAGDFAISASPTSQSIAGLLTR